MGFVEQLALARLNYNKSSRKKIGKIRIIFPSSLNRNRNDPWDTRRSERNDRSVILFPFRNGANRGSAASDGVGIEWPRNARRVNIAVKLEVFNLANKADMTS